MKNLKIIPSAVLISIAIIIIVYTIWFVFMQFLNLPTSYYELHDGKGAERCINGWFCMMKLWGVKCCDFIELILEYFNIGILLIINSLIPIILITLIVFIRHEKSYPL